MELKTLKDLEEDSSLGCYGGIPSCEYHCSDIITEEVEKYLDTKMTAKEFIEHFFNLDEDLSSPKVKEESP